MSKVLAPCGMDCAKCDSYKATIADDKEGIIAVANDYNEKAKTDLKPEDFWCDGCITSGNRKWVQCPKCTIRICALEKDLESCALCDDYTCDMLLNLFKYADEDAQSNLEEVRREAGISE